MWHALRAVFLTRSWILQRAQTVVGDNVGTAAMAAEFTKTKAALHELLIRIADAAAFAAKATQWTIDQRIIVARAVVRADMAITHWDDTTDAKLLQLAAAAMAAVAEGSRCPAGRILQGVGDQVVLARKIVSTLVSGLLASLQQPDGTATRPRRTHADAAMSLFEDITAELTRAWTVSDAVLRAHTKVAGPHAPAPVAPAATSAARTLPQGGVDAGMPTSTATLAARVDKPLAASQPGPGVIPQPCLLFKGDVSCCACIHRASTSTAGRM